MGLSLTRKSPGVGLDDFKAQGRAGAAGIALDVRVRSDDFLCDQELAMGFGQARAPRRHIINDKAAFVHRRQKLALQALVNADAQKQDHGAAGQRPASDGARPTATRVRRGGARASAGSRPRTPGRVAVLGMFAVAQKPAGQRRA